MSKTTQLYGVARNEAIVGELFPDVEQARRHLAWAEDSMRSVGLEPDVRLVVVEETVTRSRPKAYRDEPGEVEPEAGG